MELVGIEVRSFDQHYYKGDPVAHIIGLNTLRRHNTKQEIADLIVAAHRAAPVSRQDGGKLAEGRPINQVKAAAVASAKAMPNGPSERTIERSFFKAEGRTPKRRTITRDVKGLCGSGKFVTVVEERRTNLLDALQSLDLSDAALDLLTTEERADSIKILEKLVDRIKRKGEVQK